MFKKIIDGYTIIIISLFRLVLLLGLCFFAGVLIVFPLWKLATARPDLYSLFFTLLFFALLLFLAVRLSLNSFRKNKKLFLFSLLRKATLFSGIFISVALVLNYQRLPAGLVLLGTIILYGFLAFGLSASAKSVKSPPFPGTNDTL
jgi:hypothetical protein